MAKSHLGRHALGEGAAGGTHTPHGRMSFTRSAEKPLIQMCLQGQQIGISLKPTVWIIPVDSEPDNRCVLECE